jgi:hypothetical protein
MHTLKVTADVYYILFYCLLHRFPMKLNRYNISRTRCKIKNYILFPVIKIMNAKHCRK